MNAKGNVKLTIILPLDPFGKAVGGAETFVRGLVRHAPNDFDIQFIGITSSKEHRPPRKWTRGYLDGRKLNFFPLFSRKHKNKKPRIPISLCFTVALKLSQMKFPGRVLFFDRIEPAIIFRKQDNPKVGVVHNDILKQHQRGISEVLWSRFPRVYFFLENLIFKSLDSVYTVSSETLKFYRFKYSGLETKFTFLPTWADVDIFFPAQKSKLSLKEGLFAKTGLRNRWSTWVLFAGRLQKQKNPIRLIDTFAEYLRKNGSACLIMIGDGNLKACVESYIKKLSIGDHVVLLGNVNQETLAGFYRASDVLLLASNFEGMPRCVLEALACGLPAVCTNVGEVKRVVIPGFSGEVVGSFSPRALSSAIEKVLSYPKLYSESNCVRAVSEYTPQKVMQPVYDAIRKLFNAKYAAQEKLKP